MLLRNKNTPRWLPSHKALWGVLFILIVSGCISRLYFGVLVRDQAELVALSQQYMPVYDEQIPVLTWLMTGLFRATDYFILWPDIYKFTCLGLCLFSVFRLTFHVTKQAPLSLIAALSVFFLPTFHEDMLGEVTHTAALLAATALSTDWLVRKTPQDFGKNKTLAVLILFWLFGFLAKHTMGLIIVAQLSAYWLAFKPAKSETKRLPASAALTFSLILPIYMIIAGQSATLGQGLEEFQRDEGFTRGLADLMTSILSEAAVFILLGAVAFIVIRRRKTGYAAHTPQAGDGFRTEASRFLGLTLLFTLLLFIPFIIIADISVFRDRWLAPALMLLAPLFALALSSMTAASIKHWQNLLIVFVCALGIFRAVEPFVDTLTGAANIDNAPLAAMSENLRRDNPDINTYIASNYNLVATMKLQDPALNIYTQKTIGLLQPGETMPDELVRLTLTQDPVLIAPHLDVECEQDTAETLRNWTYSYALCKPVSLRPKAAENR